MFGMMPAYGFFIRHAKGIELHNVGVSFMKEDKRPAFVLDTVDNVELDHCKAAKAAGVPALVMIKATAVSVQHCTGIGDFEGNAPARKDM